MEHLSWTTLIIIALGIGLLVLISRVFLKLLKYFIIATILAVIGFFVWSRFQPERPPVTRPAGKEVPRSR
jgi:Na+/H+-dicarboxylate symporter